MALAAGYDPVHGRCTVYVADDGGALRATAAHRPCQISSDTVRQAMHGLHGFGSWALGLVERTQCPSHVKSPCPGLYLGGNDNGTWGTAVGGHGTNVWHDMHCCGDSGAVLTDWRVPTRVVIPRGSGWTLRVSHNGAPPIGSNSETVSQIGARGIGIGVEVQTLPGRAPAPRGIYFAIRTLPHGDEVVRNVSANPRAWRPVGPILEPPGSVTEIEVADGGRTVFVLQGARGKVLKLGQDAEGHPAWVRRSSGLRFADNFVLDPFDGQILYATDVGDPTSLSDDRVMRSTNGGRTWELDAALTNLAHARGRFRMACAAGLGDQARVQGTANGASPGFRYQCTLEAAAFDPTHPARRFVVLDPAGVFFSRDAGSNWVRLPGTSPIDRPTQAFFDPAPNPATGDGSLYVALHGHGLIRLDAPWSRIPIPTSAPAAPPPPPKPPPPPPPTGATAITLNCPARVTFPGLTVTGALAPPLSNAVIRIDILGPPDISTREITASTDAAGDYSFAFNGPRGALYAQRVLRGRPRPHRVDIGALRGRDLSAAWLGPPAHPAFPAHAGADCPRSERPRISIGTLDERSHKVDALRGTQSELYERPARVLLPLSEVRKSVLDFKPTWRDCMTLDRLTAGTVAQRELRCARRPLGDSLEGPRPPRR